MDLTSAPSLFGNRNVPPLSSGGDDALAAILSGGMDASVSAGSLLTTA